MKLKPQYKAFTLVELLVVITIIATLAGISFPVYNQVQEQGKRTKALAHAKQLGLSCKLFAGDYDGVFPRYEDLDATQPKDAEKANKVFDTLIKGGYVPDETLFVVQGSGWSNKSPNMDKKLDSGENHWGYVRGITDTDPPNWPLIGDGWVSGQPGVYSTDPKAQGGVWKGKKAIVIRVDMSGKIENTNSQTNTVEGVTVSGSSDKNNIFLDVTGGWLSNCKALDPY